MAQTLNWCVAIAFNLNMTYSVYIAVSAPKLHTIPDIDVFLCHTGDRKVER